MSETTSQTYLRWCRLCGRNIEVAVGPEMHSLMRRRFLEHINRHSRGELADFARRILLEIDP